MDIPELGNGYCYKLWDVLWCVGVTDGCYILFHIMFLKVLTKN